MGARAGESMAYTSHTTVFMNNLKKEMVAAVFKTSKHATTYIVTSLSGHLS